MVMETPKWPTREVLVEVLSAALSTQEQVDEILGLFEPFRMVEIRGFLGPHYVTADELLLATAEVREYRSLQRGESREPRG